MANKLRILVLGAEGFIGKYIVKYFVDRQFIVVGCDLFEAPTQKYTYVKVSRLSPEWEEVFHNYSFDVCINASGSGNVPYSVSHPFNDFEANALDTIRILDAIRKHNPECRYLHISSAAVYGNPAKLPILEEDLLRPLSPYGWHKLIAEQICKEYYEIFKTRIAIIRPFSVYGSGLKKQLLWDICNKLQNNDEIELYGTGKESRDFIHVTDLVALIGSIVKADHFDFTIVNAASGIETTIAEIAEIFESCYESKKKIKFSGQFRVGDPLNWRASVVKAESIGYLTKVSLEDGIMEYVNWFKNL